MFVGKQKYERLHFENETNIKNVASLTEALDSFYADARRVREMIDELRKEAFAKYPTLEVWKGQPLKVDPRYNGIDHMVGELIYAYRIIIETASKHQKESTAALEENDRLVRRVEELEKRVKVLSPLETEVPALRANNDYLSKRNSALEKEERLAEDAIIERMFLQRLLEETTKRLNQAEDIYINAWDAGRMAFPALMKALREYEEKCGRDDMPWRSFEDFKALSYTSDEAVRIAQYDMILKLYNERIAKLRAQDMDEEDKEEAIQAMKRLRDREIELLANAEVENG